MENEGGLEWGVATVGMTEEETVGLHRIRCEEQAADGGDEEEVGAFQKGWAGVAAFGGAVADEETGDVAHYEALIKVGEQMGVAQLGPTALA